MDAAPKLVFRVHAIAAMFERHISESDVQHILLTGKTIESYPDDKPYPSRLVLGWRAARPLHVVVADNERDRESIIVTVYEPDPDRWETGFARWRSR